MTTSPGRAPVAESIAALVGRIGLPAFVSVCTDLLGGAPRERFVEELRWLTAQDWAPGSPMFNHQSWGDFWVRSWGARGLLHAWHDSATSSVVAGLADEHYRPAEMCLKVSTRHVVAGAGEGAALLAAHPLPRVRAQAMRCLGVVGDTEHLVVVDEALEDEHPDVRRQAGRAREAMTRRLDL